MTWEPFQCTCGKNEWVLRSLGSDDSAATPTPPSYVTKCCGKVEWATFRAANMGADGKYVANPKWVEP